jgi:hypothetical protein
MYYGDLKQMIQGNETMEVDTIAISSQASFGVPWYLRPFALVCVPLFLGAPLALAFAPTLLACYLALLDAPPLGDALCPLLKPLGMCAPSLLVRPPCLKLQH